MLQLKIIKGPTGVGQIFPLDAGAPTVLGRGTDCAVKLLSAGVSKNHARLTVISPSRIELEDLGSSNGTYVNGLLVRKQVLQPGDSVAIHDYVLQITKLAPRVQGSRAQAAAPDAGFNIPGGAVDAEIAAQAAGPKAFGTVTREWLEQNIYPLADRLSSRFDVRALFVGFFMLWSGFLIMFTASPFSQRANTRVQEQSIQVARLYARQLVRVNQLAVQEQRYKDLVWSLDARPGESPGVISSFVFDAQKGQILAPQDRIGESLPNTYAVTAVRKDDEFVQLADNGIAYVSAPIKVGSANGTNETVATAFVVFDSVSAQFTFASLMDQAVSSLLFSLLVSALFMIFLYRWVEGSVMTVTSKIDEALKKSEIALAAPVKWPAIAALCEQISFLLGRASGQQSATGGAAETSWAVAAVDASGCAAAAFDSNLTVIAWNVRMERIIGIRASIALGADISGASRDIAFETAVRELATETVNLPWTPAGRDIEFSGKAYKITMVSGQGASFVTIALVEG